MNYPVHISTEWQFHAKSNEVIVAFLACPVDLLTEHEARAPCYASNATNAVCYCMVARQHCTRLADSL